MYDPFVNKMAFSGSRFVPQTCVQAMADDETQPVDQTPSTADIQPRSTERDFDYVERPSEDFFCPVSLELLLEPQLTSCCGHHLSLEAATRLQREGKACPLCNGEQWSAVLDKYHRRKVHEVRVRCWHIDNGCVWVGEVNDLKRHADVCEKRFWECQYCALKCTYREGEEKHWPACLKFPEPCPNRCEVGSVERCNMEQHRSVCSLEPVACEMKEFGCSVVVPRKELATHMRESELQHLTAMTVLNLRLSRQLQQDSTERDRKIAQLQQEMAKMKKLQEESFNMQGISTQAEINCKISQMQTEMNHKMTQVQTEVVGVKHVLEGVNRSVSEQRRQSSAYEQEVQYPVEQLQEQAASNYGCEVFTYTQYSGYQGSDLFVDSVPFYTHHHGYKLKLRILYYPSPHNDIGASLYLMKGEYDRQLIWPLEVKVRLELLNQAGDHHHVVKTAELDWSKSEKERAWDICTNIIKYTTLERYSWSVRYMKNDCLRFKIIVTVL